MVTAKYNKANGYEHDCDVIYGDTDSVMVHFGVPDNATAMELGKEAADYVSATFVKPIKLEFDKVDGPTLWNHTFSLFSQALLHYPTLEYVLSHLAHVCALQGVQNFSLWLEQGSLLLTPWSLSFYLLSNQLHTPT